MIENLILKLSFSPHKNITSKLLKAKIAPSLPQNVKKLLTTCYHPPKKKSDFSLDFLR